MRIVCWQTILMKYHTLFLSKTGKGVAEFGVCCSSDWVNSLPPGKIFVLFCSVLIFSKSTLAKNYFRDTVSVKYLTVWIQIRPGILSGLIWVQTVCKGYERQELNRKKNLCFSVF